MGLKEMLKKAFSNKKNITLERYKAAKFGFIATAFLFFINFYLVGANFYLGIFASTLGLVYILLLLSYVYYIYFFIKKSLIENVPGYFFSMILIILFILFLFLLLPIAVEDGFSGIINIIRLYS